MQVLKWNLKGVTPTAVLVTIADGYAEQLIKTRDNFSNPGEVPMLLEGKFTVDTFGTVTPAKNVDPAKLKSAAMTEKADREMKKKLEDEKIEKERAAKLEADRENYNVAEEEEALKRSKVRAEKVQKGK